MIVIHKEDRTISFSNLRKREEETEIREAAATGRMGSSHVEPTTTQKYCNGVRAGPLRGDHESINI